MSQILYPIGIQNFEKLRKLGALYVDKTQFVRSLVETGGVYFLGRPRRFGKSLLLSTIECFFEGRRDLFRGLAIDSWNEWDWGKYPIIHIDLNAKDYTYKESVYEKINARLSDYEKQYEVEIIDESLEGRFMGLIKAAYNKTGREVVILIDEYDKPILDTLHIKEIKALHSERLRAFYSVLKSADRYLKFCFLTGVTRFGQLNVFSGLNNLQDISLSNEYAAICGISEEELRRDFHEGVARCAEEWGCSVEMAYKKLKANYDGYHFSPALLDIYNPWSVLNAIKSRQIDIYWNATGGGSSFIHKLLEGGHVILPRLEDCICPASMLRGSRIDVENAIPVLYQSGYLTIKSYDPATMEYTLKYPNREVERGFLENLLPAYSGESEMGSYMAVKDFVADVATGDIDGFMMRLKAFFESFPYENAVKTERQFQNIMYCIMSMMGLQVELERHSSFGSADMIVFTKKRIYIFEFKVDKSPEVALEQIEKRGYATPFAKDSREIVKVGVEFSFKARTITRWAIA